MPIPYIITRNMQIWYCFITSPKSQNILYLYMMPLPLRLAISYYIRPLKVLQIKCGRSIVLLNPFLLFLLFCLLFPGTLLREKYAKCGERLGRSDICNTVHVYKKHSTKIYVILQYIFWFCSVVNLNNREEKKIQEHFNTR